MEDISESQLCSLLNEIVPHSGILLSSDVLDSWDNYKSLLESRVKFPNQMSIRHFSSGEDAQRTVSEASDVYGLLMGEFFSENIMLEMCAGTIRIHNNAHANLAVCIFGRACNTNSNEAVGR